MSSESNHYSTVLIVSDPVSDSQQLTTWLEREHYDVLCAKTVDDAKSFIDTFLPDLILVDERKTQSFQSQLLLKIYELVQEQNHHIPIIHIADFNDHEPYNNHRVDCLHVYYPSRILDNDKIFELMDTDSSNAFSEGYKRSLLCAIRSHLEIQSLREQLLDLSAQHTRICRLFNRELAELEDIQKTFLPENFPSHPELELAAFYKPSIQVGGDYYDVFSIDDDHWAIVIADVSGHGSAAAVVMALTKVIVNECGKQYLKPGSALLSFNEKITRYLMSEHYVTIFYAVLNIRSMEMTYSSAGHHPVLYYSAIKDEVRFLKTEPHFPLKTFENKCFEEKTTTIDPGDKVLLFTDGVTNLQNPNKQMYGTERLIDCYTRFKRSSPEKLVKQIVRDTEHFRRDFDYQDDFTLLVLGRSDSSS